MISLREIMKKKSPSKENFAAEGGKNLFTQPLKTSFGAKRRKKPFYTTPNDYLARSAG
jgi:hypothetical protein